MKNFAQPDRHSRPDSAPAAMAAPISSSPIVGCTVNGTTCRTVSRPLPSSARQSSGVASVPSIMCEAVRPTRFIAASASAM